MRDDEARVRDSSEARVFNLTYWLWCAFCLLFLFHDRCTTMVLSSICFIFELVFGHSHDLHVDQISVSFRSHVASNLAHSGKSAVYCTARTFEWIHSCFLLSVGVHSRKVWLQGSVSIRCRVGCLYRNIHSRHAYLLYSDISQYCCYFLFSYTCLFTSSSLFFYFVCEITVFSTSCALPTTRSWPHLMVGSTQILSNTLVLEQFADSRCVKDDYHRSTLRSVGCRLYILESSFVQ